MLKTVRSYVSNGFHRIAHPVAYKIKSGKLSYLTFSALVNIKNVISEIKEANVPGIFIETGCALGGSTIQIGLSKEKDRKLKVYDVFGMIPPPTEQDGSDVKQRYEKISAGKSQGIAGDTYYGYKQDLKNEVIGNLNEFGLDLEKNNIELIQGLYENTLTVDEPVAFAHIDCDWYSSVMTCLKAIEPNLSLGGIIIVDDYYDWSGCKKAVDEYFDDTVKKRYEMSTKSKKLIIKRVK